jgi:hypothetical protein
VEQVAEAEAKDTGCCTFPERDVGGPERWAPELRFREDALHGGVVDSAGFFEGRFAEVVFEVVH